LIRLIPFIKVAALLFMAGIVLLPLSSPELDQWFLDDALLLTGILFLCYALFALKGFVLKQKHNGYRLDWVDLILLGAFPLYLLYIGNERFLNSLDTLPTRHLPSVIIHHATFDLSADKNISTSRLPYSLIRINGKVMSGFPIGTAFAAVPYTAIAVSVTKQSP
jgi:hypothetical protein